MTTEQATIAAKTRQIKSLMRALSVIKDSAEANRGQHPVFFEIMMVVDATLQEQSRAERNADRGG